MTYKPLISCPHCDKHLEANTLAAHRIKRSAMGIDVFECPECGGRLKFEPAEYMLVRQKLSDGELPKGVAIEGVRESEVLPSESRAIDAQFGGGRAKSKLSLIAGWIVVAVLVYLFFFW